MHTNSKLQKKKLLLFPIFFITYEMSGNLSTDIYLPALLSVAKDFRVSPGLASLTISVWLLGDAFFQWLMGPLADGYGKKNVLMLGGLLFVISTALCGLSTSFPLLLLARFLQGIGVCSMMISGYATIYESFSGEALVKLLSLLTSFTILAPLVGPLLGSYLLEVISWRGLFALLCALSCLSLFFLYFSFPEPKTQAKGKLELKKAFRGYKNLLKNKKFLGYNLSLACLYSSMVIWITASAPLLMKEFSLGEKAFGLAQIPVFAAYILGAQLRGHLHKRLNLRNSILGSLVTSIGASLVLSFLAYQSLMSLWNLLFFVSLLSLAIGFVMPALNKEAFGSSSEEKGVTSAMFYMIMIMSGTFFSVASGTLSNVSLSFIYWLLNLSTMGSLLIFRKMIPKT